MIDPDPNEGTLELARRSFRAFYSIATPEDALWMDALVLSWTAFVQNTTIPRQVLSEGIRDHVERSGNRVELLFMRVRDRVRECPTFHKLVAGDQRRIALVLFDPFLPVE
jgi:hypothetical protein